MFFVIYDMAQTIHTSQPRQKLTLRALFFCLILLFSFDSQVQAQDAKTTKRTHQGVKVDTLTDKSGLRLRRYEPRYNDTKTMRIRLVTGSMPQNDTNIMICMGAANTSQSQPKAFDQEDIVGVHVYDGEYNYGGKDNHNTGAFVYYRVKGQPQPVWKFIRGTWECEAPGTVDINDPLRRNHTWDSEMEEASDRHGMGFAQKMLIHNGQRLPYIAGLNDLDHHRCLVEDKGQLKVIEALDKMTLEQFVTLLVKLKVTYAICLDVTHGRDYGYYQDNNYKNQTISKKVPKTYATNWICFVATPHNGTKTAQEKKEEEDVLPPIIRRAPRDPNLVRRSFVKVDTVRNRQLVVWTPTYSSVSRKVKARLVCDTMPNMDNENFILVAEAAFTEVEDSRHFRHNYVCGNHVVDGKFYAGAECGANTGVFVYYNDTSWTFRKVPSSQRKALMMEATKAPNGFAFEQIMLFQDGQQVLHGTPLKMTEYYRCLAQREVDITVPVGENGKEVEKKIKKLCIIESVNRVTFDDFIAELKKYGVTDAIYMDMGSGWNHAFYRDRKGNLIVPHRKRHDYCTNWIVFEMPKSVPPQTAPTK